MLLVGVSYDFILFNPSPLDPLFIADNSLDPELFPFPSEDPSDFVLFFVPPVNCLDFEGAIEVSLWWEDPKVP